MKKTGRLQPSLLSERRAHARVLQRDLKRAWKIHVGKRKALSAGQLLMDSTSRQKNRLDVCAKWCRRKQHSLRGILNRLFCSSNNLSGEDWDDHPPRPPELWQNSNFGVEEKKTLHTLTCPGEGARSYTGCNLDPGSSLDQGSRTGLRSHSTESIQGKRSHIVRGRRSEKILLWESNSRSSVLWTKFQLTTTPVSLHS